MLVYFTGFDHPDGIQPLQLGRIHQPLKADPLTLGMKKTPEEREKRTVLIVEDERIIAENLKFIVEENDYRVVGITSSGEDAIQEAARLHPDLLLMDVRIQGRIDGIEAASCIREKNKENVPVIFLSAHPQEKFPHLDDLDSASFLYLTKPYSPDELLAAMQTLTQK